MSNILKEIKKGLFGLAGAGENQTNAGQSAGAGEDVYSQGDGVFVSNSGTFQPKLSLPKMRATPTPTERFAKADGFRNREGQNPYDRFSGNGEPSAQTGLNGENVLSPDDQSYVKPVPTMLNTNENVGRATSNPESQDVGRATSEESPDASAIGQLMNRFFSNPQARMKTEDERANSFVLDRLEGSGEAMKTPDERAASFGDEKLSFASIMQKLASGDSGETPSLSTSSSPPLSKADSTLQALKTGLGEEPVDDPEPTIDDIYVGAEGDKRNGKRKYDTPKWKDILYSVLQSIGETPTAAQGGNAATFLGGLAGGVTRGTINKDFAGQTKLNRDQQSVRAGNMKRRDLYGDSLKNAKARMDIQTQATKPLIEQARIDQKIAGEDRKDVRQDKTEARKDARLEKGYTFKQRDYDYKVDKDAKSEAFRMLKFEMDSNSVSKSFKAKNPATGDFGYRLIYKDGRKDWLRADNGQVLETSNPDEWKEIAMRAGIAADEAEGQVSTYSSQDINRAADDRVRESLGLTPEQYQDRIQNGSKKQKAEIAGAKTAALRTVGDAAKSDEARRRTAARGSGKRSALPSKGGSKGGGSRGKIQSRSSLFGNRQIQN